MTEVAEYCRDVESYLMRVNGGHLVRIVGPAFALVRRWADEGIPLSAVYRGIDQKAERHRRGTSTRPLRIEFCEADVREVYEAWRRAIGAAPVESVSDAGTQSRVGLGSGPARRSHVRDLDRAIDRLVTVAGRLDVPDAFRDDVHAIVDVVVGIRGRVRGARGDARVAALTPLADLDRRLLASARVAAGEALTRLHDQAEGDLAAFRQRLTPERWADAVEVTIDRGLRNHFGLPDLSALAPTASEASEAS